MCKNGANGFVCVHNIIIYDVVHFLIATDCSCVPSSYTSSSLSAWLFKAAQKCIFCAKKWDFRRSRRRVMEVAEGGCRRREKAGEYCERKEKTPLLSLSHLSLSIEMCRIGTQIEEFDFTIWLIKKQKLLLPRPTCLQVTMPALQRLTGQQLLSRAD